TVRVGGSLSQPTSTPLLAGPEFPHSLSSICTACRAWRRSSCGAGMMTGRYQMSHQLPTASTVDESQDDDDHHRSNEVDHKQSATSDDDSSAATIIKV